MWLQIELPVPARISELVIESALPFGFGRGGRGGAGAGEVRRGGRAAQLLPAPRRPRRHPAGSAGPRPRREPGGRAGGGRGGGPPAAGPVAYSVQVSADGTTWGAPVAQGAGQAITTIAFAPVTAKFVRITETGSAQNARVLGRRAGADLPRSGEVTTGSRRDPDNP